MNTQAENKPTNVKPIILGICLVAAVVSVAVLVRVVNDGGDTVRLIAAGGGSLVFVSLFGGVVWRKMKS